MSKSYRALFALIAAAVLSMVMAAPSPGRAQYLDPRASQALAVCNSALGAGVPECAQLRAATGGGLGAAAASGVPGLGGLLGVAAGVARGEQGPPGTTAVYNACMASAGNNATVRARCEAQRNAAIAGNTPSGGRTPAGAITPSPYASQAVQQQYVDCVQRAGVNQNALMACSTALQAGVTLPQMQMAAPGPYDPNTNTAMTIANNGQAYRDCITRMGSQPMGANACTALLNAPAGSLPGSVPGGAYNPPAQNFQSPQQNYNPPAPAFPGAIAPVPPSQGNAPFDPLG